MCLRVLTVMLAGCCFGSFTWSVWGYFQRPSDGRLPARMRVVAATGTATMVSHLGGLALVDAPPRPGTLGLASVLYVASLGLFWWALSSTGSSKLDIAFAPRPPRFLAVAGPYRLIRHPLYAAYTMAWVAGAVAIAHWWAWTWVLVMGWQYRAAIIREERQFLTGRLREEYLAYRRVTGMVLPARWRLLLSRSRRLGPVVETGDGRTRDGVAAVTSKEP